MSVGLVDVLIAEDNTADAELVQVALEQNDRSFRFHLVRDGEEALDFLLSRGWYSERRYQDAPRLILLDIRLPKINGLEVLRVLRHDPRTRLLPVVLLTSSTLEEGVALGYHPGANSYIQKPTDFQLFRQIVHHLARYWLEFNEPPPLGGRVMDSW
ncbi:MAG: response regulator [Gemmatimonadota bacterium]